MFFVAGICPLAALPTLCSRRCFILFIKEEARVVPLWRYLVRVTLLNTPIYCLKVSVSYRWSN